MSELFASISRDVAAKKITEEAGVEAIREINFLEFDIKEIEQVQNANWLPDDVAVDIMRKWMRQQDNLLLELRANLVLTPTVVKSRLEEFVAAIAKPSNHVDLTIENVIHKLATGGGVREAVNVISQGLITCVAEAARDRNTIEDLFSYDPEKSFLSAAKADASIIIGLPPFLRLQLTSYVLGAPPKREGVRAEGSMSGWHLQGSNDENNFTTFLDIQDGNTDLQRGASEKVFPVANSDQQGFYRYFKLTQKGTNHQGNTSIILQRIDFSGKLTIVRD